MTDDTPVSFEGLSEEEERKLRASIEKSRFPFLPGTYFHRGPAGFEDWKLCIALGKVVLAIRGTVNEHDKSAGLSLDLFRPPDAG